MAIDYEVFRLRSGHDTLRFVSDDGDDRATEDCVFVYRDTVALDDLDGQRMTRNEWIDLREKLDAHFGTRKKYPSRR